MRGVAENVSRNRALVLLRYTLVIAMAYLLLVEYDFSSLPTGLILVIVIAVISNVVIMRLPPRITNSTPFNASIIVGDTVWISAVFLYSGLFRPEFFYLYFFVLFLAAVGESLGLIAVGAIVVCAAYIAVLSATGQIATLSSSRVLIRIPFLFTAAVFYGYLVDEIRRERQRAREETDRVGRLEEIRQRLADHALQLEQANEDIGREISDRKGVEETLREKNETLQAVVRASPAGIITLDREGRIKMWNPAAERIFGWSAQEVLDRFPPFVPEDRQEEFQMLRGQIMQGAALTGVEVRRQKKDGSPIDVSLSTATLHDANANIIGIVAVVTDITERKRRDDEFREMRQYLTRLIEGSTDAIISTSKDGNVVLFNKGAEILLGYQREEVIGRHVTVIYESEARAKEIIRQMRQHGGSIAGFETVLRAKDGVRIPVLISASILFDAEGQEAGSVGFSKDLRERKLAEQTLQTAKEYAENLIGSSLDIIVSVDANRHIVEFNPAAEQTFGYPKAEVLGRPADFLYADPSECARVSDSLKKYAHFAGEVRNRRKNGEIFHSYLSASVMRDANGGVMGQMGISRDITEQKRAEEALRWLAKAVETMELGVTISDTEGNIVYTNPADASMHGYTVEELIGKDVRIFAPTGLRKPMPLEEMNKIDGWRRETVNIRKDETTFPVQLISGPVTNAAGETIGIATISEDITERKWAEEALRAQARELATKSERLGALGKLSHTLVSSLDPQHVFNAITEAATQLFEDSVANLWLIERDGETLTLQADIARRSRFRRYTRIPVGQGLVGWIAREKRRLLLDDIQKDPRAKNMDFHSAESMHATMGVPLLVGEKCLGSLTVSRRSLKAFDEEDLDLLSALAAHAVIAIGNARHMHEAKARARRLRILSDVTRLITSSLDHQEVMNSIVKAAAEVLEAELVRLWVGDETTQALHLQVSHGSENLAATPYLRIGKGQGVIGAIWETGEPAFIPDLRREPRWLNTTLLERTGLRSFAGLPLTIEDRVIGVLSLLSRHYRVLSAEEREVMELFAHQAAISLNKTSLYREMAQQKEYLEETVIRRERAEEELRTAQLQLIQSAKFESVGQLAAGVAHEVKNPLHIIQQGLAYLARASLTPEDDKVDVILERMDNAVKRADRVILGLLDFSVSSAIDLSPAELNAAVEDSLLLVRHELVKAHVTMVTELGEDLPLIKLDRQKIGQVFVNLFMNAIQAMPAGGTLTVRTYAKELTEFGRDVGHRKTGQLQMGQITVVAEVEDTGTGIPPEKLGRVFDPFFTTKPIGEGTGLGLSVTRKIIELHGGTIDITNREEGGVRVTLTFRAGGGRDDAKKTDPLDQRRTGVYQAKTRADAAREG
ncbi:MAG: PAS domain S-box protein [Candidatus Methylomirabilales bacterium]